MSGTRYVRWNKENLVVRVQSNSHSWREHGEERRKGGDTGARKGSLL